ncbi:hypothetical protein ABIF38_002549 [Bradyrhizobium japonicum]|jgi:hypothetical protein|uniref:ETC complex I subunit n=1 Tax=Bradyrhizobium elkanii TaxID=29448 RepID=A0ABV4FCD0_BRAEL|nr:NADH dehydrogenase ubiquinone Fe-S protein 4 [Bradyrhizobium elkanii]MBP2431788.1 hypothetical protein [Bradyrhizobium elkanii]MCP1735138.1 hypothetical protein [Bradyrhizobium elkanii]MCP1752683.1 hypothetical protein [Bradyrhizobium elkanii]MCP1978456.1 hypothetical protein [Bradyrhizobium elkanii]MCS3570479.1 hypothetical protein [Bradyrhizobium elkanii]
MPANARSTFPADAQAVIYRVARSVMTSAPRRKEEWKLKFERRTPLSIEPLMGWTEDEDPLAQLELSFPSAEAAIAYARGQELQYLLLDRPARDQDPGLVSPHGVPAGPAAPDLRRTSETLMRAAPRTITRRMMPFPRISVSVISRGLQSNTAWTSSANRCSGLPSSGRLHPRRGWASEGRHAGCVTR